MRAIDSSKDNEYVCAIRQQQNHQNTNFYILGILKKDPKAY
jgi:hypothetical protein